MKKIIIIGCPGAGKSTFARKLRDLTGLPLYYLDMLWHKPDGTAVCREEFDAGLRNIVGTEAWIIDGNYRRTLAMRLEACDTVFLLDFPVDLCLSGARSRVGKKREDMPWVETEFDEEFRQWILDFPQRELPSIYALLDRYKGRKEIVVLRSRKDAEEYLEGFDRL